MDGIQVPLAGISEAFHGIAPARRDAVVRFWSVLGYAPVAEGRLDADAAFALYGHRSGVTAILLEHPGCLRSGSGRIRLQVWDIPAGPGLGAARPLLPGSLWMGMYTRDILSVRDALQDGAARGDLELLALSGIANAPLADPAPEFGWFDRFLGLREMMVLLPEARIAFIQRAGFDRPGFGWFDDRTPLPVTEMTHANVVEPVGGHDAAFYKDVLGLGVHGAVHDGGTNPATVEVLMLEPEDRIRVERLQTPGFPSGLLQLYAPLTPAEDVTGRSRPGQLGLTGFGYRVASLEALRERALAHGAVAVTPVLADEFGRATVRLRARDGVDWLMGEEEAGPAR